MTKLTIRELRRRRFMTQKDLADAVGVNINSVVAWEKGAHPRPKHFRALCEVFQIAPEELAVGKDEEEKERAAA